MRFGMEYICLVFSVGVWGFQYLMELVTIYLVLQVQGTNLEVFPRHKGGWGGLVQEIIWVSWVGDQGLDLDIGLQVCSMVFE